MAKLFLPRHGRTHCSGGSDPIPCLPDRIVIGEAYKDTDQVISTSNYTKLTTWDNWTIEDDTVIDQTASGLLVRQAGYYLLSLEITWTIGAADQTCVIVIDGGTSPPDGDIESPIISLGVNNRVMAPIYLRAGSDIDGYVQHISGTNRSVGFAMLKAIRLHASPPLPYWA